MKVEMAQLEQDHCSAAATSESSLHIAQRTCRAFAQSFHSKIPLELRDMIYEEVWKMEADQHALASKPTATSCNCHNDPLPRRKPLCVQVPYVGTTIAKEAALAYYRSSLIVIRNQQVLRLSHILLHDAFNLGITPADHIRHLELDLTAFDDDEVQLALFSTELPALLLLRHKATLHLRLKLKRKWRGHMRLEADFRDVGPVLRELRDGGAGVEIMVYLGCRHGYDVSDYFDMPVEQWARKWGGIFMVDRLRYIRESLVK